MKQFQTVIVVRNDYSQIICIYAHTQQGGLVDNARAFLHTNAHCTHRERHAYSQASTMFKQCQKPEMGMQNEPAKSTAEFN